MVWSIDCSSCLSFAFLAIPIPLMVFSQHLAHGQLAQGRDVIGINGKIAATSAA